jgi:hypothetical protein
MALYFLKASGEYNAAVREWETKPETDKTWANIKIFISTKHAKENKQNKLTAKQFKANLIEEQAKATKELIANLTEAHAKQMEILIKSMTDPMKEMLNLMKTAVNNPANANNKEKKYTRKEKQRRYKKRTCLQALQQKTSFQTRKRMLGTRNQCFLLPILLEVIQKHLKVHRVLNRK